MPKTLVEQLSRQGIQNTAVLHAIDVVPREQFVASRLSTMAQQNEALPIECGQTISQPYVVARMTELLLDQFKPKKVLEIGTGSGYQAAILAQCVPQVYTVERYKTLYKQAKSRFARFNYDNIHCLHGDGFNGWPQQAPFDGIVVTAAATGVPDAWFEQLAKQGRIVVPLGVELDLQYLTVVTFDGTHWHFESYDPVVFVPMVSGKSQQQ